MANTTQLEWLDLCNYIKINILKYNEDKIFPKILVLRLRGLARGEEYAKGETKKQLYSYSFLKALFIFLREDILKIIDRTEIKDEKHLCNLIMRIAQDNINDFKDKVERSKEQIISSDIQDIVKDRNISYKKKNKKIKGLW